MPLFVSQQTPNLISATPRLNIKTAPRDKYIKHNRSPSPTKTGDSSQLKTEFNQKPIDVRSGKRTMRAALHNNFHLNASSSHDMN